MYPMVYQGMWQLCVVNLSVSFSVNEELFNTRFSGTNSSKKPADIFQRRLILQIAIFHK